MNFVDVVDVQRANGQGIQIAQPLGFVAVIENQFPILYFAHNALQGVFAIGDAYALRRCKVLFNIQLDIMRCIDLGEI